MAEGDRSSALEGGLLLRLPAICWNLSSNPSVCGERSKPSELWLRILIGAQCALVWFGWVCVRLIDIKQVFQTGLVRVYVGWSAVMNWTASHLGAR